MRVIQYIYMYSLNFSINEYSTQAHTPVLDLNNLIKTIFSLFIVMSRVVSKTNKDFYIELLTLKCIFAVMAAIDCNENYATNICFLCCHIWQAECFFVCVPVISDCKCGWPTGSNWAIGSRLTELSTNTEIKQYHQNFHIYMPDH
jgi:hypothetical protein